MTVWCKYTNVPPLFLSCFSGMSGLYLSRLPELLHGQRWEKARGLRCARESLGADAAHTRHQPHQHHSGCGTPQPGDHQHPSEQPPQCCHSNGGPRDHGLPVPQPPTRVQLWGQPGAADWMRGWDSKTKQTARCWLNVMTDHCVSQTTPQISKAAMGLSCPVTCSSSVLEMLSSKTSMGVPKSPVLCLCAGVYCCLPVVKHFYLVPRLFCTSEVLFVHRPQTYCKRQQEPIPGFVFVSVCTQL